MSGFLSEADLVVIRERAERCDDEHRARRGQPPRSTRCHNCATILTLLAHIRLSARAASPGAAPSDGVGCFADEGPGCLGCANPEECARILDEQSLPASPSAPCGCTRVSRDPGCTKHEGLRGLTNAEAEEFDAAAQSGATPTGITRDYAGDAASAPGLVGDSERVVAEPVADNGLAWYGSYWKCADCGKTSALHAPFIHNPGCKYMSTEDKIAALPIHYAEFSGIALSDPNVKVAMVPREDVLRIVRAASSSDASEMPPAASSREGSLPAIDFADSTHMRRVNHQAVRDEVDAALAESHSREASATRPPSVPETKE